MTDAALEELGATLDVIGDYQGARALFERRVAALQRNPPDDRRVLRKARLDLGTSLMMGRDREGARKLQQEVVDELEAQQSVDELELMGALAALATTLSALGRYPEALPLYRRVDAAWSRSLSPDDPTLLSFRLNFALVLQRVGRLDEAAAFAKDVLERRVRRLPPGDPSLQRTRNTNMIVAVQRKDHEAAMAFAEGVAADAIRGISDALLVMSPREAEQIAMQRDSAMQVILGYASFAPAEERRRLHELGWTMIETARSAVTTSARIARQIATGADALLAASRRLEAAERALRERFAGDIRFDPPTARSVAAALPAGTAAVSFRRYSSDAVDPKVGADASQRMIALVLRQDGVPVGVELGQFAPLSAASDAWRNSIRTESGRGKPLEPELDAPSRARDERALDEPGDALRKLVFDPLRAELGDARRLILVPDDVLCLVPFDALPDGDGVLGDHFEIEMRSSLAELVAPAPPLPAGAGALVLAGGIDFGPPSDADAFAELPATGAEVAAIADVRRATSGADAVIETLAGADATKARVLELAPRARFLHLATHGVLDASVRSAGATGAAQSFAPLALCGVALANANAPSGAQGRLGGILSGEEIVALDLGACELAVLSACETNVGERRSGQGIASLQTALAAAGARATITSLWRVPDEPTRELMIEFYRRVWQEHEPKARALWNAKRSLRARGASLADWAGWVLTGDPE